MGRKRKDEPSYLCHKATGRGYSRINGKVVYWPGKYGANESKAAHRLYCAQLLAHGNDAAKATRPESENEHKQVIVATLVKDFLAWADSYYRTPDGTKTTTDARHRQTAQTLLDLFASFPVCQFGPKQVRLFLTTLIEKGLARKTINYRLGALKQMWKWAAYGGIVHTDDYNRIRDFPALRAGRLGLPEPKKITPVSQAVFAATLPFLRPPYNAIASLQRLTGCRPSEILALRPGDIDYNSTPWKWTLEKHKSQWRGKEKVLYFGPQARQILEPLLENVAEHELVFSGHKIRTSRIEERRDKARAQGRRVQDRSGRPSRATKGRKPPGEKVQLWSYENEIARAAAFAGVEHWTPNQLRHLKATELRRDFGLEAAQIGLGHAKADVTQIYAERDETRLKKIAEETG